VLHTLADEWMWRRSVLAALGAKDYDPWDTVLQKLDGGV
jgi:hypothetical protein